MMLTCPMKQGYRKLRLLAPLSSANWGLLGEGLKREKPYFIGVFAFFVGIAEKADLV